MMQDNTHYKIEFVNTDNETIVAYLYKGEYPENEGGSSRLIKELKVLRDDAIVIEQLSDGVFAPIKPTTCTINLMVDDVEWDLYTPESTGIKVHIFNRDKEVTLFIGYVTPCIYTQDFTTKSEIAVECVDVLSVLDTIKYTPIADGVKGIFTMDMIIKHILIDNNLRSGNIIYYSTNNRFWLYNLQESNFFDDDNEPMSCKEVLEEICKYMGVSAVEYNSYIYFIDYDSILNTTTMYQSTKGSTAPITLTLRGLFNELDVSSYKAGTPNLSLDLVYNKVPFSCNLYEVDGVTYDFFDDLPLLTNGVKMFSNNEYIYNEWIYKWRATAQHTEAKNVNHIMIKPYYFNDSSISDTYKGNYYAVNYGMPSIPDESLRTPSTKSVLERVGFDCGWYTDTNGKKLFVPKFKSAYPIKVFTTNEAENPTEANWQDYILFSKFDYQWYMLNITQGQAVYLTSLLGLANTPALVYEGKDEIPFSISGGTSWITFKGDLYYLHDAGDGADRLPVWFPDYHTLPDGQLDFIACPVPYADASLPSNIDKRCFSRSKDDAQYGEGWNHVLTAELLIGDKWWNGFAWQDRKVTFKIPYHDDSVNNADDEKLSFFTWIKPVTNTNYTDKVGEEAFAIPITEADLVHGLLKFTIYTPNLLNMAWSEGGLYDRFATPNVFMRGLEIGYKYTDDTNWADDVIEEDDIVYENVIDSKYSEEMDEIELKINSWYEKKPISKSYALDLDKLPLKYGGVGDDGKPYPQEALLLDKYCKHYKEPKKMYTINYKLDNVTPYSKYNDTLIVDGFSMDVLHSNVALNLIEL